MAAALLALRSVSAIGSVYDAEPPAIWSVSSRHDPGTLTVEARGTGLTAADSVYLCAPDGAWRIALGVVTRTDTSLIASASVAALMPPSLLEARRDGRAIASAPVDADAAVPPADTYPAAAFIEPNGSVRPKDFAFFYDGLGRFHLFYTRHNGALNCSQFDENEKSFGHVWSTDLVHWSPPDTTSFTTAQSLGSWDAAHVWAPTLVQRGPTYYMIYTGVDASGNQSIGCATTDDINAPQISWQRRSAPMFALGDVTWGSHDAPEQLRDSFLMPDPSDPERFVMYYTAVKGRGAAFDTMSVGVARSEPGSMTHWTDRGAIYMTDFKHTRRWKTESPHAFLHVNDGNVPPDSTWYLFFTSESTPASIRMLTHAHDPMDPSETMGQGHWTTVTDLLTYLGNDQRVANWNATEYLRAGGQEYLAGYTGHVLDDCTSGDAAPGRIWIMRLHWMRSPGVPDRFGIAGGLVGADGSGDALKAGGVGLRVTGPPGAGGKVRLRVALPAAMETRLEVYDLAGRSVRALARGAMAAGNTDVEWDGRDAAGNAAGSGVYLVRLTCPAGSLTVRTPLLR